MIKEFVKSNDEVIAKIKAEEAAKKEAVEKAEAAEQARVKAEQEKLDPNVNKDPRNPELAKAAADAAAKIERAERDENDIPVASDNPQMDRNVTRHAKAKVASEKLRLIALSYPRTTGDEHIVFGFGGYRYTLGDLRDITGVR